MSEATSYFSEDSSDSWCLDVNLETSLKRSCPDEWESDDEWCHEVNLDVIPQEGGGLQPLFAFPLKRTHMPRTWKNIVNKSRHSSTLQQLREPLSSDNLGEELTTAIHRALQSSLAEQTLRPSDRVHFTLQADAFAAANNHCFQSTQFTAEEIEVGGLRLSTYLQQLARQLNSSQAFTPGDDFTMEVTTIRLPPQGTGNGKRRDPIKSTVRGVLKRSRIPIKNTDDLCCARAIVTMKAWADEKVGLFLEHSFDTLRRGRTPQTTLAQALHRNAQVPEGGCSLPEIAKFQTGLPDYQIKVLCLGRPHMITFVGPPSESGKRILLIQDGDHFDGCTSFGAFLNKSYFCHDCNCGFDRDTHEAHPCNKQWCRSCYRRDCPDFLELKESLQPGQFPLPTVHCDLCHRSFFGNRCLTYHSQSGESISNKKSLRQNENLSYLL